MMDWLIDCSETWVKCSTAKCWRTELRYLSSRDLNMFAKRRTSWSSVNIYFFTRLLLPFEIIKLLKIFSLFIFIVHLCWFSNCRQIWPALNHSFPIPGGKTLLRPICYLVQTNLNIHIFFNLVDWFKGTIVLNNLSFKPLIDR